MNHQDGGKVLSFLLPLPISGPAPTLEYTLNTPDEQIQVTAPLCWYSPKTSSLGFPRSQFNSRLVTKLSYSRAALS